MGERGTSRGLPTTSWSLVIEAAGDGPAAREALERLCSLYWQPLFVHARCKGHPADRAADVTQGFLLRFLERGDLERVQRDRGRFRSYLLKSLENYMSDLRDHELAAKRGGGRVTFSIDADSMAQRCERALADRLTPEAAYGREWALTLLERVTGRLGAELQAEGAEDVWRLLGPLLDGSGEPGRYRAIAGELGLTEGALRVRIHRLRRRLRELTRKEVAETLADPTEVNAEIRHLMEMLSTTRNELPGNARGTLPQ